MIGFLARRLMLALLTMWAVSVFSFVIIQLPPGDWFQSYINDIRARDVHITEKTARELVITLQKRYGVRCIKMKVDITQQKD